MDFARRGRPTFRSLFSAVGRVCRKPLRDGVRRSRADRYVKRHGSVGFALALTSCFLLGIDSLRQLKERLDVDSHLREVTGLRGISHAQLPRLLQDRPSALWLPLIETLISLQNRHRAPSALRIVDTSFFAMSAKLFSRIHGRVFEPEAAGMKLGLVIDPANDAPLQSDMHVGQGNDIEHVATLIPPEADIRGLTYIFDRGFLKLDFYADLIQRGACFVTRAHQRVKAVVIDVYGLDPAHPEIVADQTVRLGTPPSRGRLRQPVRCIEIKAGRSNLTLWSSDLYRPAHEIAQLYRQRWQIEVIFRWLKSTIGCIRPLGYSANAAEHTLYAAIVAYLIFLLLADTKISQATKRLTAKLKNAVCQTRTLFYAKPTPKLLQALGFM